MSDHSFDFRGVRNGLQVPVFVEKNWWFQNCQTLLFSIFAICNLSDTELNSFQIYFKVVFNFQYKVIWKINELFIGLSWKKNVYLLDPNQFTIISNNFISLNYPESFYIIIFQWTPHGTASRCKKRSYFFAKVFLHCGHLSGWDLSCTVRTSWFIWLVWKKPTAHRWHWNGLDRRVACHFLWAQRSAAVVNDASHSERTWKTSW